MRADAVGTTVLRVTLPVEAGKVREFARAIHDVNPIYRNESLAREAGFRGIPTPPTFTAVAAHFAEVEDGTMSPARAAAEALELDLSRTVNGEQRWEYVRMPQVGDRLRGESVIADVSQKQGRRGGELTFVTVETTYRDDEDEIVLRDVVTIIQTEKAAE